MVVEPMGYSKRMGVKGAISRSEGNQQQMKDG
jgi:hypothetical protein